MRILEDIISTLDRGKAVKEVRCCSFWTAVVSKHCGLASSLNRHDHPHETAPVKDAGTLAGRDARALAELSFSENLLEASIGVAAINSLIDVDLEKCVEINASEIILEKGRGKRVAVIGSFPFLKRIAGQVDKLWVFEQRAVPGTFSESEIGEHVPEADVVAISGTTLINNTFERITGLCRKDAFVVLLGPSSPLSPVLFDYGIDVVSGSHVGDIEKTLRFLSEGAIFRQVEGVTLLSMSGDRIPGE